MVDSVGNAIGIDKVDMCGKLILIEEQHSSDANFILSAILSNTLEKGLGICFVLFHSSFGHYHNIGTKLGYDLNILKEQGQLITIEPMKILSNVMNNQSNDCVNAIDTNLVKPKRELSTVNESVNVKKRNKYLVHQLFIPLYNKCCELRSVFKSVIIIVDDISHMFHMNFTIQNVWYYIKLIRSLMQSEPTIALYIMTHVYNTSCTSFMPATITVGLKHLADLIITVSSLNMGCAKDITGKVYIYWKIDSIRRMYHWTKKITYTYTLLDRQVQLHMLSAITIS